MNKILIQLLNSKIEEQRLINDTEGFLEDIPCPQTMEDYAHNAAIIILYQKDYVKYIADATADEDKAWAIVNSFEISTDKDEIAKRNLKKQAKRASLDRIAQQDELTNLLERGAELGEYLMRLYPDTTQEDVSQLWGTQGMRNISTYEENPLIYKVTN